MECTTQRVVADGWFVVIVVIVGGTVAFGICQNTQSTSVIVAEVFTTAIWIISTHGFSILVMIVRGVTGCISNTFEFALIVIGIAGLLTGTVGLSAQAVVLVIFESISIVFCIGNLGNLPIFVVAVTGCIAFAIALSRR